jgi:hypothetical protein
MWVWQDKYFSRQLHIYEKKNPAEPTSTHTYCFGQFLHQIMTGKNRWQPADWNGIIDSVKELWHLK